MAWYLVKHRDDFTITMKLRTLENHKPHQNSLSFQSHKVNKNM